MFDEIGIEIVLGTHKDNELDPDDPNYKAWLDVAASRKIRLSKTSNTNHVSDDTRAQLHYQLDKALNDINLHLVTH